MLIVRQVIGGLEHIWSQGIIHRDIKLDNIMVHFPANPEIEHYSHAEKQQWMTKVDLSSVEFQVKISDFGLSTKTDNEKEYADTICGTPLYCSPQVMKSAKYTYRVDVWALGVVVYELLTGRPPFYGNFMATLVHKVTVGDYDLELKSLEVTHFIASCLQSKEENRMTREQLR